MSRPGRRSSTAALGLFRAGGYDKTTMRAIADEAGVSLGNAYYYFGSKEHLVQAFYDQVQVEHAAAAEDVLAGTTAFARPARAASSTPGSTWPRRTTSSPGSSSRTPPSRPARCPRSASESQGARAASIVAVRDASLDGSDLKLTPALRAEMPELLWLLHMGVVLFWVHDSQPRPAAHPRAGRARPCRWSTSWPG